MKKKLSLCFLFLFFRFGLVPSLYAQNQNTQNNNDGSGAGGMMINAYAREIVKKVGMIQTEADKRLTHMLTPDKVRDLPIGIGTFKNGKIYAIAIDSAYRDGQGWSLSAYAAITLPGTDKPLAFAGRGFKFSSGGVLNTKSAKIMLVSNYTIYLDENTYLEIPGDGKNFIEFDCSGFKGLGLKGNIYFRDKLSPDSLNKSMPIQTTRQMGEDKQVPVVKASFELYASDLQNMMVTINISPFKVNGLNDFGFEVKNASLDWSDFVNPSGFKLPEGYEHTFGTNLNLWRGFYIQKAEITYYGAQKKSEQTPPNNSTNGNQPQYAKFMAEEILVDDAGFSGKFGIKNLLTLKQGNANGWAISIDDLSVQIVRSDLIAGKLLGKIQVPFLGDDTLSYSAIMMQRNDETIYTFSIKNTTSKTFKIPFGGTLVLLPNSTIEIEKNNSGWYPKAVLNGTLSLDKSLKVPSLRFEGLALSTIAPYINIGTIAFDSGTGGNGSAEINFKAFKVGISDIKAAQLPRDSTSSENEVKVGLRFKLLMSFSQNPTNIAAEADVTVSAIGQMINNLGNSWEKLQTWRFHDIRFHGGKIDVETNAFKLKGVVEEFENDPKFGTGFKGQIQFSFPKAQLKEPITISAYFGRKDDFNYWQVGAIAPLKFPIFPPIKADGIMLSMANRMQRDQNFNPDLSKIPTAMTAQSQKLPTDSEVFKYTPDKQFGLSFMLGLGWVLSNEKVANGDATLEVAFNASGGLRFIRFTGSAYIMTDFAKRGGKGKVAETKTDAPMYALLDALYDHNNSTFHANSRVFVNVMNGMVKGEAGPNNLMGEYIMHFDPQNWYVYMGKPSKRNKVSLFNFLSVSSYFMIGTQIEALPLPPQEVRDVFNGIDLSLMRNENAAANASGFALGVELRAETSGSLAIFYYSFKLIAGADAMIRNYGVNAYCAGRTPPLGINGWYAMGQAYVFMHANVGVEVDMFFGTVRIDILNASVAALLQAKLPNPTWMRGMLSGQFSVLGGRVSGTFNLDFELGENCEIVSSGGELGNIEIIQDLKPSDQSTDISVFTSPQVSFNMGVDKEFVMQNQQGETHTYKVVLVDLKLSTPTQTLTTTQRWNEKRDLVALRTEEILPPNTQLTLFAKLRIDKKVNGGQWQPLTDAANGEIVYEEKMSKFTTGNAPPNIPDENVLYAYPSKGQYNFYRAENGNGYIKLDYGQAYLFPASEGDKQWEYYAKFVGANESEPLYTVASYDITNKLVQFGIPASMKTEKIYKMDIVKVPKSSGVASNLETKTNNTNIGNNQIQTRQNILNGTITQNIEKSLYKTFFRSSKYNNFSDKIDAITGQQDVFDIMQYYLYLLGKRGQNSELFDKAELKGINNLPSFIKVEALPQNNWFNAYPNPILYRNYPSQGTITWRDPNELGIAPNRAVRLTNAQVATDFILSEAQAESGQAPTMGGQMNLLYYMSFIAFKDQQDLKSQVLAKYFNSVQNMPPNAQKIVTTPFMDYKSGNYPVSLKYYLPGQTTPSSEKILSIAY